MSKLVFKLKSVPEEEAEGVRKVLQSAGIEFYETPGGSLGWSVPAIWIKQDSDFAAARDAIDQFQEEYVRKVRESRTETPSINPWKVILLLILCSIVFYLFNSVWLHQWF